MSYRVLLADDSLPSLMVMKVMLEKQNCVVTTAERGDTALKLAQACQYELILLDEYMPGLNGSAVASAIVASDFCNKNTPIVALTGAHEEEELDRLRAAGVSHIIKKPASLGQIIELLGGVGEQSATHLELDKSHAELIDPAIAGQLVADLGSASNRLFGMFAEELETLAGRLTGASSDRSSTELLAVSHILKNSAALYGASPVAELARKINEGGETEADESEASELIELCTLTSQFVRKHYFNESASS